MPKFSSQIWFWPLRQQRKLFCPKFWPRHPEQDCVLPAPDPTSQFLVYNSLSLIYKIQRTVLKILISLATQYQATKIQIYQNLAPQSLSCLTKLSTWFLKLRSWPLRLSAFRHLKLALSMIILHCLNYQISKFKTTAISVS